MAVVDNAGNVVERVAYQAYGKPVFENLISGSTASWSATGNRYSYTGREYESATGLYYYRARWYDAETGRFTQKDPIGFAGGDTNLYAYVFESPVSYTDPSGEFGVGGAVVGGIIGSISGYQASGNWKGATAGMVIGAASGFFGQFGESWYAGAAIGAFAGGVGDLAWQTVLQGKNIRCVNWVETGASALQGGLFGGISGVFRELPNPLGVNGVLLGRNKEGILNSNDYIRFGWSWKGSAKDGKNVLRFAVGSKRLPVHYHFP